MILSPEQCLRLLRASPDQLDLTLAFAPFALFFGLDGDGVCVFSKAGGAIAALDPDRAVGRSFVEIFADLPWVLEAVQRALAGEVTGGRGELHGRSFELHSCAPRDPARRIAGVVCVAVDVSGRSQTEERAVSLLKATLDATNDGIFTVDSEGHVGFVNQKFLEMWRIPEAVMRRPHFSDRMSGVVDQLADPEGYLSRARGYYARPDRETFEILEFKDGRVYERYSHPQMIGDTCVGRVLSFRDVTLMRRAEEERDRLLLNEQAARAAAENAVRVRDEFLSIASHELRTPLTTLRLRVQSLLHLAPKQSDSGAQEDQVRRMLDAIDRQSRRIDALVGALLDVSRIASGSFELSYAEVDLTRVVSEVVASLDQELKRAGCVLSLCALEPVVGRWDRTRLEQVLFNLLANAIRHGARKPIEVRVERADRTATLSVRDHGDGIAPELQTRIFDKFERGAASRNVGGLGLGLYIARRIVEGHGGSIAVESALGAGATFIVKLPR